MIRVIPTIQSIEPSQPILIVKNDSTTGVSEPYELIVSIQLIPVDNYECTAKLSIDNTDSYLFDDGSETKQFPFHASQNGDEVRLKFRIKNKNTSFPKLLLSVRTNANTDPATKRVDSKHFSTKLVSAVANKKTNA